MDNPRLFYPWAATGQHGPSQHVAQPPPTLLQAAYYPTRNKRYKLFFSFFFSTRNLLFIYDVIQFIPSAATDNIQTCSGAATQFRGRIFRKYNSRI